MTPIELRGWLEQEQSQTSGWAGSSGETIGHERSVILTLVALDCRVPVVGKKKRALIIVIVAEGLCGSSSTIPTRTRPTTAIKTLTTCVAWYPTASVIWRKRSESSMTRVARVTDRSKTGVMIHLKSRGRYSHNLACINVTEIDYTSRLEIRYATVNDLRQTIGFLAWQIF